VPIPLETRRMLRSLRFCLARLATPWTKAGTPTTRNLRFTTGLAADYLRWWEAHGDAGDAAWGDG
jgi:hypothetical protein